MKPKTPSERISFLESRLCAHHQPFEVRKATVIACMRRLGCEQLARDLAKEHRVTFDSAFVLKMRTRENSYARMHFFAIMRWTTGLSYPALASIIDTDHTTVIDSVRRWEDMSNGKTQSWKEYRAERATRANGRRGRPRAQREAQGGPRGLLETSGAPEGGDLDDVRG